MSNTQLHDLARIGAQARLLALDQERDEILKMFSELRDGANGDGFGGARSTSRKRRTMSAAERKAVSERMRAYWAARRAKRAGAKKTRGRKSASAAKRKGGMSAEARKAQGERMKAFWAAKRAAKQAASGDGEAKAAGATNSSLNAKRSGRKAGRTQGRKK